MSRGIPPKEVQEATAAWESIVKWLPEATAERFNITRRAYCAGWVRAVYGQQRATDLAAWF